MLPLTVPRPPPEIPEKMTWSQLADLQAETMSALIQCNHDKRAIREIEAERVKKSPITDDGAGR
ncbi:Rz1 lytic protein [Morganella morganii]|nr:Rz1 lytic protein [Morganella morganii]